MNETRESPLDELMVASDWLQESGSHLSALLLLEFSSAVEHSELALSLDTDRKKIQRTLVNHHWDHLKLSDITFDVIDESKVVPKRLASAEFHLAAHVLDSIVKPLQTANVAFARALLELPDVEFWQVFIASLASSQLKDCDLTDAMVRCGFVWRSEVIQAKAREHNAAFRDLAMHYFSPNVLELCPGTVARDCRVIPFDSFPGGIVFATSEPGNLNLYEQLRFILNCDIRFVTSSESQIQEAIDLYYPMQWDPLYSQETGLTNISVNLMTEVEEAIENAEPRQRQELDIQTDEEMERFRGLWRSVEQPSEVDP